MYLKNILKICLSIICFLIFFDESYGASRILSSEFLSLEGKLIILADVNKDKHIISVDLRNCRQLDSIKIDKSIKNILVSEYIPSYVISGGSSLMIYNISNGKQIQIFDDFIRSINIISQSDMGEYIAASDGITVALYQFKKEGLTKLYSKEFAGSVSSVYPDIESNTLYVVERSGKISVWSFSGKLQKNINIDFSITDMIYDEKTGKFLASTQNGLYYLNKDDFTSEKLLNGKIISVLMENYSSRLQVMTTNGYTVYDYPVMRAVINMDGVNGHIVKSDAANIAAFSGINYIRLYDLKKNIHTATIAVDSLGVVNFYPPEIQYGSNITSSFISAAANSQEEKQVYDKDKICAPIAAMVAGVYIPENKNINNVNINSVDDPYDVSINKVQNPKPVNTPSFTFKGGSISVPEVKDNTNVADVTFKEHKSNIELPKNASDPETPKVKDIGELLSSNIPNWVANRKNLPKNNAVSSAGSEQDSLISAKRLLKTNMVKEALSSIIKDESLSTIENNNAKKRVLWQSAAKAVNSLESKILTVDTWKSPAGQVFTHVIMDDGMLKDKTKSFLQGEIKKYSENGYEKYMQEKAQVLE